MWLLDDIDTPAPRVSGANEEVTRAIQEYPVLARRVADLQSAQTVAQIAVTEFEASRGFNAPQSVRESLAALTRATIEAASALSEYRQRIRDGVAEAKKQGTITAPDLAKLAEAGLAGYARPMFAFRANAYGAASRVNHIGQGLGYMPSVLRQSSSAAVAHAAPRSTAFQSAKISRGGGGRGVRGLGVVPLVVIGYGLALAIGAAIVGGSLVAAYRLTAEAVARGEAVRDQNAAALDAWRAQVAAQTPPGGGPSPVANPIPPAPPIPLPPMPELPGSGGVVATVAKSTVPVLLLAALAVGAVMLFRRNRNA